MRWLNTGPGLNILYDAPFMVHACNELRSRLCKKASQFGIAVSYFRSTAITVIFMCHGDKGLLTDWEACLWKLFYIGALDTPAVSWSGLSVFRMDGYGVWFSNTSTNMSPIRSSIQFEYSFNKCLPLSILCHKNINISHLTTCRVCFDGILLCVHLSWT